jgi:Ca2+-binding RTX toxin-like protein
MYGDAGSDTMEGGAGDDTMEGGNGVDWLYGQNGNDALSGDAVTTIWMEVRATILFPVATTLTAWWGATAMIRSLGAGISAVLTP